MRKKIIILFLVLIVLSGCKAYDLNTLSLEDSIDMVLKNNINLYNENNIGFRYYLPRGCIIAEDRETMQVIKSNGVTYYLNVDLISYYNKTEINIVSEGVAYKSYSFVKDGHQGFLEITQMGENLVVKMAYNYAIIEAEILESDLKKAVMNMTYILSSLRYNDIVINNKFGEDVLVFNESVYQIFGPIKKEETKTYAYYLENYENYEGPIQDKIKDPDVIGN